MKLSELNKKDYQIEDDQPLKLSQISEYEVEDDEQEPNGEFDGILGAVNATTVGMGDGATFGTAPIISGAVGATGEFLGDLADLTGLTTDAKLEAQGFDIQDKTRGLEGLMNEYYKSRDMAIQRQAEARDKQPVANVIGGVIGGMAGAGPVAGMIKGAGKAGQLASKILPSISNTAKGLSTTSKVGLGALEGAKAGALTGFGSGASKITNPMEVVDETLTGAGWGTVIGGGIPLLGAAASGIGEIAGKTGIGKAISTGVRAAKEGLNLGDESAIIRKVSDNINKVKQTIAKHFGKKDTYYEFADEMGIRINAGEDIDNIIEDYITNGIIKESEKPQLQTFIDDIRSIQKDINIPAEKAKVQTELSASKKIDDAQRKTGATLETSTEIDKAIDDLRILPDVEGNLIGTQDRIKVPVKNPDGTTSFVEKDIITSKAIPEPQIKGKRIDTRDMSLKESDKLQQIIYTDKNAPQAVNELATKLYNVVKVAQEEAMEKGGMSSLTGNNHKLSTLFNAMKVLGIKSQDFFSKKPADQVLLLSKMANKFIEDGRIGDIMDNQAFKDLLNSVEPKSTEMVKDLIEYSKSLASFTRQNTDDTVSALRATVGSIPKAAGLTANVIARAGQSVKKQAELGLKEAFEKVESMTPDKVKDLGFRMANSTINGAKEFAEPLLKSADLNDRSRQAIMYMLTKQPAFREAVRRLENEEQEQAENDQLMMEQQQQLDELTPVQQINPSVTPQEPILEEFRKRKSGEAMIPYRSASQMNERSPSMVGEAPKDVIADNALITPELKKVMSYENNKGLSESIGGWNKQTQRWKPHKSVEGGADTIGYGIKLVPGRFSDTELERFRKDGISDDEAKQLFLKHFNEAKQDANDIIERYKIPEMTSGQKTALAEMIYQMGKTKIAGGTVDGKYIKGFPKTLEALTKGDWEAAKKHALDSDWARDPRTKERAEDVASRLIP